MADDKSRIEKLKLEILKEQSEEYAKHQKLLDDETKKRIKAGKGLQGQTKEEKAIKEKMFSLEKAHLEYLKATNKAEYEKMKNRAYEAEAYADERMKQIDGAIDKENDFWFGGLFC